MLVVYLRSSSMGTFKMCEWDYFLTYQMGLDKPAGKKARIGNCMHKALELLARKKNSEQKGEKTFSEPESGKTFKVDEITEDYAYHFGLSSYDSSDFTKGDLITANEMFYNTLSGPYNPLKHEIVEPELFFDIEIQEPWAKYKQYSPYEDKEIEGALRVRGTMDLIVKGHDGILHYIDWKTGARLNWNVSPPTEKTMEDFMKDPQLLLYYFALKTIYPDKEVQMTIHYLKDGGPFTLPYGDEEYQKAKDTIKKYFDEIINVKKPNRIKDGKGKLPLACRSFCHWGKTLDENGVSLCDSYHNKYQQLGMDLLTAKYGNKKVFAGYSGGGVTDRENKE